MLLMSCTLAQYARRPSFENFRRLGGCGKKRSVFVVCDNLWQGEKLKLVTKKRVLWQCQRTYGSVNISNLQETGLLLAKNKHVRKGSVCGSWQRT